MDRLELAVQQWQTAYRELELYKRELEQRRRQFNQDNAALIEQVQALTAEAEKLEAEVRAARVAIYDGKNKSPIHGVSIREFTELDYPLDKAIEYARERLPDALTLNRSIFDKLAKTSLLDFVIIRKVVHGCISSQLKCQKF